MTLYSHFFNNDATASERMSDLSKFPISIRAGNSHARKGWRKDSEMNIRGENSSDKVGGGNFHFLARRTFESRLRRFQIYLS